ncbi:unnamed protein product [Polarella glacialis]|uniref:CBM1 domain-containing protein n=1 Tax=Polarella glacialis TaxID=89957 RepID=A0A813GC76_POLGL|nr:unnamed protein product [Polarella glacialis]
MDMAPIARVLAVSAILVQVALGSNDTSCLFYHGAGCNAIHNEQLCVISRDGQAHDRHGKYHRGSACAWSTSGLCKKLAYVPPEDLSSYTAATCKASETIESRIAAHTLPSHDAPAADSAGSEGAVMPWSEVALAAVDGGTDRACRGVVKTQTGAGSRVYKAWTAVDLKDCEALCTGECQGIEYHASTKYCEVWYEQIFYSASNPGFECYRVPNKALDMQLASLRPHDMTCLKPVSQGCSSIKDRCECLSARDAGDKKEMNGTKLAGEPCVWCGGVACLLGSDSMCEPFDYLMRAVHEGSEPASAANFEIPACVDGRPGVYLPNANGMAFTPPPAPSQAQLALLMPAPDGCANITDRGTCLSSKDAGSQANWEAYRLKGEACVWCGGAQCTDRSADKCMPYDLLMNGQGKYYSTFYAVYDFKVAAFVEYKRALSSSWDATCLSTTNSGCPTLTDQFTCLSSKDGRPEGVIGGRQVASQPCVWCAGGRCNSGSAALCEPYDVQMHGEGTMFIENFAKDNYEVAACHGGKVKSSIQLPPSVSPPTFPLNPPSQADMRCLKNEPAGCSAIKNRLGCLSSIDGSTVRSFGSIDGGLKIQGQPCVWCGGGPCVTNGPQRSSLCLPFDYLARGAGRAFTSVNIAALTVAECDKNKFEFGDMSCLLRRTIGCNKITDFKTCTSSIDGRPYNFVDGFKVKGQPCVWCAGGACSEQNSNLCEPFDFAVNGIGHAFDSANEFAAYSVASCSPNGIPGPRVLPTFYVLHGISQLMDCGFPNPVWQKVGQVCGFCKALIPRIQERYPTCGDYCSKNGGLMCAGAALSSLRTCEAAKAVTCSYHFALEENALCECVPKPGPTALARDFPRPSAEHMKCLDLAKNGCMAVKDNLACLGSMDASGVKIYRTVAVDGEPCVWCGGGSCTSDSNATCVPYDWMARGQDVVYAVRQQASTILAVAKCDVLGRNFENTGCLQKQVKGCNTLKDKATCLSSLDGRKEHPIAGFMIEGQPCVWCGGGACNSMSDEVCAPYDFAVHGAGRAFVTDFAVASFSTAACENGKPVPHELPSALTNAGVPMTVICGVPNPIWTRVSKTCDWCKVQVAPEAMPIFKNCSAYCAAQGNLGCSKAWTSFKHSCDVKAATTCDYNFAAEESALCECHLPTLAPQAWQKLRPTEGEMTCLQSRASGCRSIKDRIDCLSSKDGSSMQEQYGLKISGEPCVWCGDGLCAPGLEDTCAPYEWLMKGQGRAFQTMQAVANFQVAKCFSDKDADFKDVQCLQKAAGGCPSLLDEDSCLSAVDGRPMEYVAGFKVAGQPCVWCGGGPCDSLNANRCESYDFAVNGAGHAFKTFHAGAVHKMAACEDGKPAIQMLAHGSSEHGTSMQVTCGSHTPIWSKVSRSCGNCEVVVPNIQEYFKTCADYCKDQAGNPKCISGAKVLPNTCDKAADVSCDYAFARVEDALCKCSELPKVLLPREQVQQTYSQCGGSDWKGFTQCEIGAECNFVDKYYSQCVPAGEAVVGVMISDVTSSESFDRQGAVVDSVKDTAGAAEGLTPHESVDATAAAPDAGFQAIVEPAQSAQMTPVITATLPPPAAPEEVIAAPFPQVPEVLTNIRKDCWEACNQLSGLCSFCGKGNACCRHNTTGEGSQPKECRDIPTYFTWHSECVIPVHHVTPQEAASWAGAQAAAAAAAAGGSAKQRVKAAGDAASETAIRAGAEVEAAQDAAASAAIVARETGMSGQEVLDAAKRAAGKATAKASQSPAAVAEAVVAGVEEAAEQAGVQAAMLAKVDGKSVQDQAIAAAKADAYAAFDMQQPEQVVEESAVVSAMAVATDAGQHFLQAEETAKSAVKAIMSAGVLKPAESGTNTALKHAFADCYEQCGNRPGMCNGFCGIGNACCRVSGGIAVPPECQQIATFKTGHFECVVPHQATLVGLVPVRRDDSGPARDVQAQTGNQDTTGGTQPTSAPAGQGGFGAATFLQARAALAALDLQARAALIGGGVAAFLAGGMVVYCISSPKAPRGSNRVVSVEDSDEGTDLENRGVSVEDSDEGTDYEFHVTPQFAPNGVHASSLTPQFSPAATPEFGPAAGQYAHLSHFVEYA